MSVQALSKLHKRLADFLDKNQKDQLNLDIQAYTVNKSGVFRSMMQTNSPFRWADTNDEKMGRREIWPLAETVSVALWKELEAIAIGKGAVRITDENPLKNKKFREGSAKRKPVFAYNSRLRTVYTYSAGKSSYKTLDENFVGPMVRRIKTSLSKTHPARVFVQPNEKWANLTKDVRVNILTANPGAPVKTIERKITAERKRLRENFKGSTYEGIQIGHTFGGAATGASLFLEDRHGLSEKDIYKIELLSTIPAFLSIKTLSSAIQVIKGDSWLVFERKFNKKGVEGRVVFTYPEGRFGNTSSGGSTGRPTAILREIATYLREKEKLGELKGSPSYNALLTEFIEDIFLDKKITNKNYKSKSKLISKRRVNINKRTIVGGKGSISTPPKNKEEDSSSFNLPRILNIINDRLHDQIEQNMGKGRSKKVLNYQTGTFAKTAEVRMLYPSKEKNAINAEVKYMKKPYGVFVPGAGPLATGPGRSPALIFGKSIRQILIEERIAVLRRVKVDLIG